LQTNYFKDFKPFNLNKNINNVTYETADPHTSQKYAIDVIPLKEQYTNIVDTNTPEDLNKNITDCINSTVEIIGNPTTSIWKRIFPKNIKEIVFKDTPYCSFNVLVYMFQDKYKKQVSVKSIKQSLVVAYKDFILKYGKKILNVLKKQGKELMISNIEKGKTTLEQTILDEMYYLTDLDIWMFSVHAKIQVCIFSNNKKKLKGIDESLEWLIVGNNYFKENYYFVRSPPILRNEPSSYNIIETSFSLLELHEFGKIVKNMVLNKTVQPNIQSLETYLTS
jgi:hypothetical protein